MIRTVTNTRGSGEVTIPSSKSDVHRILISASLCKEPTAIIINGMSKDIEVTMSCLRELGSEIKQITENEWKLVPSVGITSGQPSLNCGESGSTLRFMLPVAAAVCNSVTVRGEGRLPERPLTELITQMKQKGCSFTSEILPFEMNGRLSGGRYTLPGNISSQYVTGLMFALPLLAEDSEIYLESPLESKAYVDMTLETLRQFGIRIECLDNGYLIPGNQTYRSPGRVAAEGDWSNAAFYLALGALKGPVTCRGLKLETRQGDAKVIEILQQFGAQVECGDEITVSHGTLDAIEIDAAEIPDLVPVLAVVASAAAGLTRIYRAERLRIKESDRLAAICDVLSRAGADIRETEDGLLIQGPTPEAGQAVEVSGYNDHRIVMAAAVAAASTGRPMRIDGTEAVEKSYPTFFEAWEQTGGTADVI